MATQVVRDFYARQKADEIARVQQIINNGTKASNNLAIGRRMMNPTYKGMVPNASGVGQRPFFINKDEVNCPLEDKVAMRGGVLRTQAGQVYGKKILARRALDIRNQELREANMPPEPSPLVELTEVESRTTELNQLMDRLAGIMNEGGVDVSQIVPDYRNLVRLIVSLSATFSQSDLAFIDNWAANIATKLDNIATLNREENALGQPRLAQRQNNSLQILADLTGKISLFIEKVAEVVDSDPQSKRAAIRAAARQIFATIGRLDASRAEAIAEEAAGPAVVQQQARRAIVPPPPLAPAPLIRRQATPEDMQRARESARRAAEEEDAKEEERAIQQRTGPIVPTPEEVDLARYKASPGAALSEDDRKFISGLRQLWNKAKAPSNDAAAKAEIVRIARARGIPVQDKSTAVLKNRIVDKAGFASGTV